MHRDSDPATPEQQAFLDALEAGEVKGRIVDPNESVYVTIRGILPHTSKSLVDYVEHIIYGAPKEIRVAEINGHFVALVEWPRSQFNWAFATMERMGSFPYGAGLILKKGREAAITEFGAWCYHRATSKTFEYMTPETPPVD